MKIAVYAICKNEEKFAKRWYNSMKEADGIFVCDTGSDDNTIDILKDLGVNVKEINIKPWRFDDARNESLNFVPDDYDICVCTDLDEVFSKGWRKELENNWTTVTTKASYNYIWNFDDNDNPKTSFYIEKIHSRHGYKWIHPVHEVLEYTECKEERTITINSITLKHYPDSTKSRAQYLPLLELSVKEQPLDDRNTHYLGREYMFNKRYDKAINTLQHHLKLPTSTWKDERCASMRYIARCYEALNKNSDAYKWYIKAVSEAPYLREPYIELAYFSYKNKMYFLALHCIEMALNIKSKPISYINESFCWDKTPYDIASLCAYNLGLYDKSLKYIEEALIINPNNQRLKDNHKIIKKLIDF